MSVTTLTDEPQVSVIISAFHQQERLERAVASVLAQTYRHYEIIVIDDVFTERSADSVQRMSSAIRRLAQPHPGVAAARNAAIRQSRGELIALLDAKDLWTADKLERCVRFLQQQPQCDVVYSPMGSMDARGQWLAEQVRVCHEGWILDELFEEDCIGDSSAVFRRRVWERLGGFDETLPLSVGHNFWLRVAVAQRFGLIREPLAISIVVDDDATLSGLARKLRVQAEMLHRFYEAQGGRERLDRERARRRLGRLCLKSGWIALREGDPAYAARLFRGATIYQPGWLSRLCFAYADWRRQQSGQPTIEAPVLT